MPALTTIGMPTNNISSTRLKLVRSKCMRERDLKIILYILLTKNICLGMSNKIFTVPEVRYDVQKTRN